MPYQHEPHFRRLPGVNKSARAIAEPTPFAVIQTGPFCVVPQTHPEIGRHLLHSVVSVARTVLVLAVTAELVLLARLLCSTTFILLIKPILQQTPHLEDVVGIRTKKSRPASILDLEQVVDVVELVSPFVIRIELIRPPIHFAIARVRAAALASTRRRLPE